LKSVPGSNLIGFLKISGLLACMCLCLTGCRSPRAQVPPAIEFTRLPPAGEGSPDVYYTVEGRVRGARPDQRVVLFARSGMWWVQPLGERPFTQIARDSTWKNTTHPGTEYAALLVDADYKPPLTVNTLPATGDRVAAVATAAGPMLDQTNLKKLDFSGYQWLVRQSPGSPAGTRNDYTAANAWVDPRGFLHLRIEAKPEGWSSAQVSLSRSLGYGSYRFVVSDVSTFAPPVVLTISTWDAGGPDSEMDIEISRWGESGGKNAQYVIQPYFVPANVVQFLAPAGRLTYEFDWEVGRVSFRTSRDPGGKSAVVASHVFTSGVPTAGGEAIQLNFYVFDNRRIRLQHGAEVIFEKFEYLP